MIVKDAVGAADDCFAVTFGIPRQPDARREVVLVVLDALLNAEGVVSRTRQARGGRELRTEFYVVANAIVQGQVRTHLPGILPEEPEWLVAERIVGIADALNEGAGNTQAVGLDGGEGGDCG